LQSPGDRGLAGSELFAHARVDVGRTTTSITFPRMFMSRSLAPSSSPVPADPATVWTGTAPPRDFTSSLEIVIGALLESERIDVATAASAAGLSVRSFQRRLTEHGLSFSDAVDAARLRKARELLLDRGVKIIEIAFALGYSDPAHFNRAFRRWTSLTPTEYRQLHLGESAAVGAGSRAPAA
jgi:AraC-like DNA-binding protein